MEGRWATQFAGGLIQLCGWIICIAGGVVVAAGLKAFSEASPGTTMFGTYSLHAAAVFLLMEGVAIFVSGLFFVLIGAASLVLVGMAQDTRDLRKDIETALASVIRPTERQDPAPPRLSAAMPRQTS